MTCGRSSADTATETVTFANTDKSSVLAAKPETGSLCLSGSADPLFFSEFSAQRISNHWINLTHSQHWQGANGERDISSRFHRAYCGLTHECH